jgi:RNA polymerase sigma factor (sigma-70 family)
MTPAPGHLHVDVFAGHRRYLFAVAYRMLGLAEDAEDVLQDAWLRFADVDLHSVDHPRAYLVTIVTRLSMDLLKSARRRREEYVGTWLPEPVTSAAALPDDLAEQADSVSFACLILLERLTPTQRVVLVLHDVLDYSHDEVARAFGSAVSRALADRRPRPRDARSLNGSSPPRAPATSGS